MSTDKTEAVTMKKKRQLDNDVATENLVGVRDNSQLLFGDKSPLLNPVILTRLFEICELSQLLTCRLVSKQWYSLSLTPFREEMLVKIDPHWWRLQKSPEEMDKLLEWHALGDQLELDFGEKPFRCYRIYDMHFYDEHHPPIPLNLRMGGSLDIGHPEEISRNFNSDWGRNIRQLDLQTPIVSSREVFRKIIFDRMPNLEKLRLHDVHFNWSNRDEDVIAGEPHLKLKHVAVKVLTDLPCSWKLFRAHFPKIQKLEIRSTVTVTDHPEHDVATQLIEAIGEHKRTPEVTIAKLTLQSLSEDTIPKINLFLEIPLLKVQTLRIDFSNFEDKEQNLLSTVFLHLGRTLQDIAISTSLDSTARFRLCQDFPCQPGPFHAVTTLALEPRLIGNLHFLAKFQNLVTLRLFQMEQDRILEGTDLTRLENVRLLNLRKFEFLVYSVQSKEIFGISEEVMTVLVKLMPNLEIFKGQLSNSSLRVLFQNWRNLRELVVWACPNGAIDDAGIIGVVPGEEAQLPNITDLKSLEVLSLAEVDLKSEATVWDGFLKMPCLRKLSVTLQPEISDDAFNALREKFGSGVRKRMCLSARVMELLSTTQ